MYLVGMSEFDTSESARTDPQTRLKFERYVFFAFFAVMVMVVIAGIIGIKRTQQALEEEQQEAIRQREAVNTLRERSRRDRDDNEAAQDEMRRKLAKAEEREASRARELGAAFTQLALDESNGGPAARARARLLLEEAQRLGAPPYLELARWALQDASSSGMAPIERSPFTCAALSRDGRYLALGRGERGIDLYLLETGRRLANWPNPDGAGEATALAFSPRALFAGYRGGQLAQVALMADGRFAPAVSGFAKMPAMARFLSVSERGEYLAAADAANNLRACPVQSPEKPLLELRAEAPLLALAADDSSVFPVVTLDSSNRVMRLSAGGERKFVRNATTSESVSGAMRIIGGQISCAMYSKEGRWLSASGGYGADFSLEAELPSHMDFAPDGTLLIGDAFGRYAEAYSFEPGQGLAPFVSMGSDSPIRFLARTDTAVVAVSADGTVSIRHDPNAAQFGRRIKRGDGRAIPTSMGIAIASAGLVWPTDLQTWLATEPCTKIVPTRRGFAAFDKGIAQLDNGAQTNAEAMLCALASGGALVRSVTGDVSVLRRDGTLQTIGALARLAPDFVCSAAAKDVVLARTGNNALVIRLENGVTTREIFAPGMPMLGAIDEQGKRAALPDRDVIRILNLDGEGESQASPQGEIQSLAFLFDGAVLCALEGQQLAFYDSASGRELLRRPTKALSMSGSGDRLFLFCGPEVRELRFN